MACTLGNKCAKNLSKQTVLLQLIIKNVVTCFFLEHSVERCQPLLKYLCCSLTVFFIINFNNLSVAVSIKAQNTPVNTNSTTEHNLKIVRPI